MAQLLNLTGQPVSIACVDGTALELAALGHVEVPYQEVSARVVAVGDRQIRCVERVPGSPRVVTNEPIPPFGSVLVVTPEIYSAVLEMFAGDIERWTWGDVGAVDAIRHYQIAILAPTGLIGI